MAGADQSKACTDCGADKPLDEFYRAGTGHRSMCKQCDQERSRHWAAQNTARHSERSRRWRQDNPLKTRQYHALRNARYALKRTIQRAEELQ